MRSQVRYCSRAISLMRARRIEQHRRLMIAAFATSSLFLVSYLVYHAQVGSVRFTRQGLVRPLYFTILITHVTLAAAVLPLRDSDPVSGPQRALPATPAHSPVDVSDLALRVGYGRPGLRLALSTDLAAVKALRPAVRITAATDARYTGPICSRSRRASEGLNMRHSLRLSKFARRRACHPVLRRFNQSGNSSSRSCERPGQGCRGSTD